MTPNYLYSSSLFSQQSKAAYVLFYVRKDCWDFDSLASSAAAATTSASLAQPEEDEDGGGNGMEGDESPVRNGGQTHGGQTHGGQSRAAKVAAALNNGGLSDSEEDSMDTN